VSAAELIAELDSEPGPVELRVCSPGGAPDAALAIFGSMRRRLWPVRVVVDGWAASSATIILMGATGGQAAATGGSLMMVHQPRVVDFSGTAADLQKAVRVLDMMDAEVARIYSKRTGISAATWREAMRAERWFTADEAVAAGLVDYVL
jgi:ATP-dependent protease ClpP protease subunit